jgi:hypothetical protein
MNMATTPKKTTKAKAPKKAAAKPAAKPKNAIPAKKTASRLGAKYACQECGLLVVVDQDCGCGTIDLVCCGEPMKKKRAACAR